MVDIILDGKGKSYKAGVNSEHRLLVSSVSRSKEHHANITHGRSFNMLIEQTPTGADDCFMYMKNTSEDTMVIEGFGVYAASAEKIYGMLGQIGTPVGGTDTVPAVLNAGSAQIADGTFQVGNDITGLSGGWVFERFRVPANTATNIVNFEADIVIPPNQTFTAYAATGGILIEGHVNFWFEEEEV